MAQKIGSHMSIAGGYHRAIETGKDVGCDCVQLFTKNNNQWKAKPITEPEVELFQSKLKDLGIEHPISHASYLINLASPDDVLWNKSIDGMIVEWQRAEQLGLEGVVVHPGAFVASDEASGLKRIAQAIPKIYQAVQPKKAWLLLENTAGQGSCLGWNMKQLGELLQATGPKMMVGVCLDTCHAHAAGYDLSTSAGLKRLIEEATEFKVLQSVRAIHLNDSKKEAGSRVDRHEHLGLGTITEEGFRRFLRHKHFKDLPMYLETEKGESPDGRDWDVVNIEVARKLASK